MMFKALVFSFVSLAVVLADCVDRRTNVVVVGDAADNIPIQTLGGSFGAYTLKNEPSCHEERITVPSFRFPGSLQLLSGTVKVTKPLKLVGQTKLLLTVKKNTLLVGTVCENGISKYRGIDSKFCQPEVCVEPTKFCKLLENPGTYDFNTLRDSIGVNGTLPLPAAPLLLKRILKGEWKIEGKFVVGKEVVGAMKVLTGAGWIYFEEGQA